MAIYCNSCNIVISEDTLEEPYGLSSMEPGCPHCGGNDFTDIEEGDE